MHQLYCLLYRSEPESLTSPLSPHTALYQVLQRGSSLPEINANHVVGISPELTYFSISQYKC